MGFAGSSDSKASACNVGDLGLILGWGRSPGKGKWQPTLVISMLGNSMGRGAWQATIHRVTNSQMQVSD